MAKRSNLAGLVGPTLLLCLFSPILSGSRSLASGDDGSRLLRAVKWRNVAEIRRLLDKGAEVNAPGPEGLTPLFWASAGGDPAVVRLLLDHGARVNERCRFGETALTAAAAWGHVGAVKLLIERGARVNLRNDRFVTALTLAAARGHPDAAKILIDHGAALGGDPKGRGAPLLAAAAYGQTAVVKLLLDGGARIDERDIGGRTALMHASRRGLPDVVEILLARGCDVDSADKEGDTALSLACATGGTRVVGMLLEGGADRGVKGRTGKTPLEIANERGFTGIVDLLTRRAPCTPAAKGIDRGKRSPIGAGDAGRRAAERPVETRRAEVILLERPRKVAQLVGEYDRELGRPTLNRTLTRFGIAGTDLGVSFSHLGRTFFLFGDTIGRFGGDCAAYTDDKNPADGLELDFVGDSPGAYRPVKIPGVGQDDMEVPVEGVSVNGKIYTYHATDFSSRAVIGRTVTAVSLDGCRTFRYLYDLSYRRFLNVSVVKIAPHQFPEVPDPEGPGLFIFGSGRWRKSPVMLAFQPAARIEEKASLRYFVGLDSRGKPVWSKTEADAAPLFDHAGAGELSAAYNRFLHKWILLYNGEEKRPGIFMRTADRPWGPWSGETTIYEGRRDKGFCRFLHSAWKSGKCDILHEPGREELGAVVYGAYMLEDMAQGKEGESSVWFTLSTWNPYTVVLMKMRLRRIGSVGR
jgi:ankyrin repeat protein